MADTAAWLVDRELPEVPVRQWVLTLPFALRRRLAYDARLTAAVLREFLHAVFAAQSRRARRTCGIPRGQCGVAVFVQRFGGALNPNAHFHALVLDGVYDERGDGRPEFHALDPPSDEELAGIAARIARRMARALTRRRLGPEEDAAAIDPLAADEPWLATLAAASASNRRIVGPEARQPLQRLGDRVDPEDLPAGTPLCVRVADVSLHAAVRPNGVAGSAIPLLFRPQPPGRRIGFPSERARSGTLRGERRKMFWGEFRATPHGTPARPSACYYEVAVAARPVCRAARLRARTRQRRVSRESVRG